MSSITEPGGQPGSAPFFSKQATVAKPGFSRWMVPPAALAVHLCIGQAYAFSVFNGPLTKVIGITQSAPDARRRLTPRKGRASKDPSGRLTQRKSATFTRWKPKVQSLQRPQKNGHLGGFPGWPFRVGSECRSRPAGVRSPREFLRIFARRLDGTVHAFRAQVWTG